MPRGSRKRVAPNIYRDAYGYAGVVQVRGQRKELRFPPTASIAEIKHALANQRFTFEQIRPTVTRGTLAAVVQSYLAKVQKERQADRRRLLQPWVTALGDKPFTHLDRATLQQLTRDWRTAGLSASRINKRISALRVCWDTIAPDALPHAISKIDRFSEPPPVARGVPLALVAEILEHVDDDRIQPGKTTVTASKAKAILRVLAWTGQPPARVMAIRPQDVRWDSEPPELYVQPRRKGAGSADAWIPLTPLAVDALKHFFAIGANGPFTVRVVSRAFQLGAKKCRQALLKAGRYDEAAMLVGIRAYDLRHSLLSALGASAPDIYAVAEYAGHASLQTTRRYMRAAASTRMRQSIAALAPSLPVPTATSAPKGRKAQRKRTKGTKPADS